MNANLYGKFRGKVADNYDLEARGRLQVRCAGLLGDEMVWADPCVPYAGQDVGSFFLPPIGANVWVELEGGNSGRVIWSGCFWGKDELQPNREEPQLKPAVKVLKTEAGSITLDEGANSTTYSITIENKFGAKIMLNEVGIKIDNGQGATIEMIGNKVSINGTALEVI